MVAVSGGTFHVPPACSRALPAWLRDRVAGEPALLPLVPKLCDVLERSFGAPDQDETARALLDPRPAASQLAIGGLVKGGGATSRPVSEKQAKRRLPGHQKVERRFAGTALKSS